MHSNACCIDARISRSLRHIKVFCVSVFCTSLSHKYRSHFHSFVYSCICFVSMGAFPGRRLFWWSLVQVFVACLFVTYVGLFCTLTLAVSMDVFLDVEMRHIEIHGRSMWNRILMSKNGRISMWKKDSFPDLQMRHTEIDSHISSHFTYMMAKTHRMPSVAGHFSQKSHYL